MLVLTRKTNEEIVIDGDIRVKVLDIQGGRIRLGITAPSDVSVLREEVCVELGLPARFAVDACGSR
jgi:carbon storage regulator